MQIYNSTNKYSYSMSNHHSLNVTLKMFGLRYFILWTFSVLVVVSGKYHSNTVDNEKGTVSYLSKVLTDALANASTYELPTSVNIPKPVGNEVIDYGTYDFVIIGGGTTGCVIARRLSDVKNWTILVLEAGKFADNEFLFFPHSLFTSVLTEYNWGFKSIPQTTSCLGMVEERCSAARGKGMGGSSLINGVIYQRGDPKAFDKWAEILNDSTWSYESLLPLFKRSENFEYTNPWAPVDEEYHGTGGLLNVEHVLPPDELTGIFLDANRRLGYNISDYNGPKLEGASVAQLNKKHGRRHDSFTAFLKPVLDRKNLELLTESFVTKIEIDEITQAATGVIFTRLGKTYKVKANKEIILSAGVFMSPKILMLSGIGPKSHLEDIGIDVIENLEVGSVLIDDVLNQAILFSSDLYLPNQTQEEQVMDFLNGEGSLSASFTSQGLAFYKSKLNSDSDFADFQLVSVTTSRSALELKIVGWKNETYSAIWGSTTNAVQICFLNINPHSRGSVRLASKDPFEFPSINFKLLSDSEERDIAVMYEGIMLIFKLLETAPYQRLGMKYSGTSLPGCQDYELFSKDYWYCFLKQTSITAYHTKGSCPMGTDPKKGAVIDKNFSVFGIQKLRVADSSIFPTTQSGHPSATCVMFGEKISDVLKFQYL